VTHCHAKGVFNDEAYITRDPEHHTLRFRRVQGMGDIVNFRKARKLIERELDEQRAAANRVRHGRSKAERTSQMMRRTKACRELEQHRIKSGDDR